MVLALIEGSEAAAIAIASLIASVYRLRLQCICRLIDLESKWLSVLIEKLRVEELPAKQVY